jgi:hypothetical protein
VHVRQNSAEADGGKPEAATLGAHFSTGSKRWLTRHRRGLFNIPHRFNAFLPLNFPDGSITRNRFAFVIISRR